MANEHDITVAHWPTRFSFTHVLDYIKKGNMDDQSEVGGREYFILYNSRHTCMLDVVALAIIKSSKYFSFSKYGHLLI